MPLASYEQGRELQAPGYPEPTVRQQFGADAGQSVETWQTTTSPSPVQLCWQALVRASQARAVRQHTWSGQSSGPSHFQRFSQFGQAGSWVQVKGLPKPPQQ
jgi:hypothetical protein